VIASVACGRIAFDPGIVGDGQRHGVVRAGWPAFDYYVHFTTP
jgi:hypothetical protein